MWFGLIPGRSPLLGESLLFSSPRGTKMFQFPRFASTASMLWIPPKGGGLSHSEIRASKVICTYTRLIAAYHVLHRLREPRHPPCALAYFLLCRPFTMKENGAGSYFLSFNVFYTSSACPSQMVLKEPRTRGCLSVTVCQRSFGETSATSCVGVSGLAAPILIST